MTVLPVDQLQCHLPVSVCSPTAPGGNTVQRLICYWIRKESQSSIKSHNMGGYGIVQWPLTCLPPI